MRIFSLDKTNTVLKKVMPDKDETVLTALSKRSTKIFQSSDGSCRGDVQTLDYKSLILVAFIKAAAS